MRGKREKTIVFWVVPDHMVKKKANTCMFSNVFFHFSLFLFFFLSASLSGTFFSNMVNRPINDIVLGGGSDTGERNFSPPLDPQIRFQNFGEGRKGSWRGNVVFLLLLRIDCGKNRLNSHRERSEIKSEIFPDGKFH